MRAYALLVAVSAFTIGCGEEDPALARFAPKLSSYPFFDGRLADQKPAAGVVPYEVISTLYADGAGKNRFLAVPPGAKIHFDPTGRWLFPDGTTIIKTFFFDPDERAPGKDRRLVETRLLKYTEGAWYAVTYVWNAAQTDAEREIAGREIHVDRVDGNGAPAPVVYQVPSTSQCKSCHGQAKKFVPLGRRKIGRAEQRGRRRLDRSERSAELVGHGIEQQGAQLFAFARGFSAAEFLNGAGALHGNRNHAANRLKGLAGEHAARDSHAPHHAHAHGEREESYLIGAVDAGLAAQAA